MACGKEHRRESADRACRHGLRDRASSRSPGLSEADFESELAGGDHQARPRNGQTAGAPVCENNNLFVTRMESSNAAYFWSEAVRLHALSRNRLAQRQYPAAYGCVLTARAWRP